MVSMVVTADAVIRPLQRLPGRLCLWTRAVGWQSQSLREKNHNTRTTTKKLPISCKYCKSRKVNDPSGVEILLAREFRQPHTEFGREKKR